MGGTVLQREVRASVTELLKDSKAALTTAQCGSLLAASAFSSSVAPLQSITMTTEALVSVYSTPCSNQTLFEKPDMVQDYECGFHMYLPPP